MPFPNREDLHAIGVGGEEELPAPRVDNRQRRDATGRLSQRPQRADTHERSSVRAGQPACCGDADTQPGVAAGAESDRDPFDVRPLESGVIEQARCQRQHTLGVVPARTERHVVTRLVDAAIARL